jgi:hypothetical protein
LHLTADAVAALTRFMDNSSGRAAARA